MTEESALKDIHLKCERAATRAREHPNKGVTLEIPLSIFHEAFGPETPENNGALIEAVAELKAKYGFDEDTLRRNTGFHRDTNPGMLLLSIKPRS